MNLAFPNRVKEIIGSDLFNKKNEDEFKENNIYKCLVSLLRVGFLCSKHSLKEKPTMKVVVTTLKSIREDVATNSITSRELRQSTSNFLSKSNATINDAFT